LAPSWPEKKRTMRNVCQMNATVTRVRCSHEGGRNSHNKRGTKVYREKKAITARKSSESALKDQRRSRCRNFKRRERQKEEDNAFVIRTTGQIVEGGGVPTNK